MKIKVHVLHINQMNAVLLEYFPKVAFFVDKNVKQSIQMTRTYPRLKPKTLKETKASMLNG